MGTLYVDEQGDWLAHFQEMPTISAFGDTPQKALEELKIAWELVKDDYQSKSRKIPVASNREMIVSLYKYLLGLEKVEKPSKSSK